MINSVCVCVCRVNVAVQAYASSGICSIGNQPNTLQVSCCDLPPWCVSSLNACESVSVFPMPPRVCIATVYILHVLISVCVHGPVHQGTVCPHAWFVGISGFIFVSCAFPLFRDTLKPRFTAHESTAVRAHRCVFSVGWEYNSWDI